jgi:hypothetical protein
VDLAVRPAADIVETLMAEAADILRRLGRMSV